jgi:hypothetical protein
MRIRLYILASLLVVALSSATALADQIILRDGKGYSGKFIRGDARVVEFQILGRVESFKTTEVAQIIFKEPELANAAPSQNKATVPAEIPPTAGQVPAATGELSPQPPVRRSPPPQASPEDSITLQAGTPITVRMTAAIDTDRNRVGDTFVTILDEPLMSGEQTLVPRGTEVTGKISYAKESGRVSGQSELILELTTLNLNGKEYPLRTSDYREVGSSRGKKTATVAGGGAALGAIVGAIAGGGKGAAVGAATGAAVGTTAVVLTHGQTLKVPAETILEFRLQSPLTLNAH